VAETSLTTPERLDALLGWLGATLGTDDLRLTEAPRPAANGSSNETAMLRCAWTEPDGTTVERGLVARTAPRAEGLFHSYDLVRQYRTMAALADTEVPVPRLVGYGDAGVLGEDFYVMEASPGEAPPDLPAYTTTGWLHDAPPAAQRVVHDETLELLARIHRLDVGRLDLGFLVDSEPGRGLEDQLERTVAWYRWAAGDRPQPTMDAVLHWLLAEVPTDRARDGLNWGDARFGNVLYEGTEPVCVLDWEMAALGPAEVDMGWWWFMNRFYTEGTGVPPLPGFPTDAEAQRHYESALGRPLRDRQWYEALAGFRFGIIFIRAATLMRSGGADDGGTFERVNPVTSMLARMLDLPDPATLG
jgi:aminoglycoside phosphotransferase (APT) family kinase protein